MVEINPILLDIARGLIIIFFTILPFLVLMLLESFEIKPLITKFFKIFICIFLPSILILIGIIVGVENFKISILELTASWYYIIAITWFGIGIIFYSTMEETEKN